MNIKELKEMIAELPDSMPVMLPIEVGFLSACVDESGVGESEDGDIFVLLPCQCGVNVEVDVKAEDFEENQN